MIHALVFLAGVLFIGYQAYRIAKARPDGTLAKIPNSWPPLDEPLPLVTVMVAAWNAAEDIDRFIGAFLCLSYPRLELVVCAGGSDGTWEHMQLHTEDHIRAVKQESGEGKQRALAKAFRESRGSIIFLTDVDCILTDESLMVRLLPILQGVAAVVTGPYRPLPEQEGQGFVQAQWAAQSATYPKHRGPTRGLIGANTAIRRDLIEESGAFSAVAPSGTDYTLAKQLLQRGHQLWFEPEAPIATVYPETVKAYVRQQARWIRNVVVLGKRYGERSEVRAAAQTMAQPWVLLGCISLGFWHWEFWVTGALLIMQALGNRLIYLRRAGQHLAPRSALQHFAADLWAAGSATWRVVSGQVRW